MHAEFVVIAESGILEQQSLLLCESLRQFGGACSAYPIKVLQPRPEKPISADGRSRFATMGAEIVELAIVSPLPEYGTTYRIFACAEYERLSQADVLIFLDSDTVLFAEPDFALENHDVAARPVDVKGMCTTGEGDPFDPYWQNLCRACGVKYADLPVITSTVDRVPVKASYNGGLTVVRRRCGLFGITAEFFQKSLEAGLVPWPDRNTPFPAGHGMVGIEGGKYWGSSQASLSLAITALGLSVRMLPASQNFPLHFYDILSAELEAGVLPVPAHVHYHHLFLAPPGRNPILTGKPGFPPGAARWLRQRIHAGKRLILVLGMHRSGTSILTKSLEALGIDLGTNFLPAAPDNPKGFWEDNDFYALNEEMLIHLGRFWDDLRALEVDSLVADLEVYFPRALALLDGFLHEKSLSGLKDPRFSILLPFWERAFAEAGIRVSFVIGFRNPLSVVASLSRRDHFSKPKALWLWALHNVLIASGTANVPKLVVDYDKMLDQPRAELGRLARFLELSPEPAAVDTFCSDFVSPELRHACFSQADLQSDPNCEPLFRDIHNHFFAWSSDTQECGLPSWDEAASRWTRVLRPIRGLLRWNATLCQEHDALREQIAQRNQECQAHWDHIQNLESATNALTQKSAAALSELTEKNARIAELTQSNAALSEDIERLRRQIREMESDLSWRVTAPLRRLMRTSPRPAKSDGN
jgi:hypothetical protein